MPLTYFPEVRNSGSTEMGNLFWVPPKVRCPEKVVKGTGFNSIDVELSVGGYKLDKMNPTWIYVYEEGGVGFYLHVLKPIEIAPDPQRNCIVIRVNEKDFIAGKSYVFKWYSSTTIFGGVIATSNAMEVTNISLEVEKAAKLQAVKLTEHAEERKVAYERAMAASFKADKAKEKKRLQDSVDDLVRRQREEQLKLMELQAQTARKVYEEEALKAAQSDENSLHHHDQVVMESREVSSVESDVFHEYFDQIDTNNDGKISMKELEGYLSKCGLKVAKKQLLNMFQEADVDHSGAIDFYGKYAYTTFKKSIHRFLFIYLHCIFI